MRILRKNEDSDGNALEDNYRPTQDLNSRTVNYYSVWEFIQLWIASHCIFLKYISQFYFTNYRIWSLYGKIFVNMVNPDAKKNTNLNSRGEHCSRGRWRRWFISMEHHESLLLLLLSTFLSLFFLLHELENLVVVIAVHLAAFLSARAPCRSRNQHDSLLGSSTPPTERSVILQLPQ